MFGSGKMGANAYATIGLETGVLAASPHKLIVMLFDGALAAINVASQQMALANIEGKSTAISKAIWIVGDGLRASLDKKAGGELALDLDALYGYISQRLLTANLKNAPAILDEVAGLLRQLRDAWLAIDPAAANTQSFAQHTPSQTTDSATLRVAGLIPAGY